MNKLELHGIMICEWDAETRCMIVSPAEGWKVNVNYPISEAHASMVTMEKMEGGGYEFIGKWLRCVNSEHVLNFIPDRWYKCMGDFHRTRAFMGDFCRGGFAPNNHKHFDLTDPRDYNPDEEPQLQPRRVIQKGTMVQNLTPNDMIKKGATGIVDETNDVPYVIWDSPEMLTEQGRSERRRWPRYSEFLLELPADPKPEPKPHQLQEYDAVECTPEERSEIIRIADECGVPMHREAMDDPDEFPYLGFSQNEIAGIGNIRGNMFYPIKAHTVPDFIAKIRGEYTAVNVTEHKHESV